MRDHVQCKLRRVNGDTQVSFIPHEFAEVGRFVKLKEKHIWTNGWEIVEVGTRLPSEYALAQMRNHKDHRRATDI